MSPHQGQSVEQLVFGTAAQAVVDASIDDFCARRLGAGIARILLRETSVGIVRGAELKDGRRVLVKVHQPREPASRLAAAQALQTTLHVAGFPCPEPLLEPTALGHGTACVEAYLDTGSLRDCHHPERRRLIAEALATHLEILARQPVPTALHGDWTLFGSGSPWPGDAHSPIFDLAATAAGAEWIDAIATRAKPLAIASGPAVAGHADFSAKHVRFDPGDIRISAVYDWDSLSARPEHQLVGVAAATFCTRFDLPGVRRVADPDEIRAFVDEYAAVRASVVDAALRRRIAAAATLLIAYTARCEHAVAGAGAGDDPDSFTAALRRHGSAYLRP